MTIKVGDRVKISPKSVWLSEIRKSFKDVPYYGVIIGKWRTSPRGTVYTKNATLDVTFKYTKKGKRKQYTTWGEQKDFIKVGKVRV